MPANVTSSGISVPSFIELVKFIRPDREFTSSILFARFSPHVYLGSYESAIVF